MKLPRLHVVTHDALLAGPDFAAIAAAIMDSLGVTVALHLRGRDFPTAALYQLAAELAPAALKAGSLLLINDRVDIALAVRAGAHLHAGSVPLTEARRLLHRAPLGYSAHSVEEAALAAVEGADYVFLGTIYATPSHADRTPAGAELIARASPVAGAPVIAIGGVTPARVGEIREQGGYGVAVIRGVWSAEDPVAAAQSYLRALGAD